MTCKLKKGIIFFLEPPSEEEIQLEEQWMEHSGSMLPEGKLQWMNLAHLDSNFFRYIRRTKLI